MFTDMFAEFDRIVSVYLFVITHTRNFAYLCIRHAVQYLFLRNVKHVESVRIPILYNALYSMRDEYFVSEARAVKKQGTAVSSWSLHSETSRARGPTARPALRILRTNRTGSKGSAWLYCVPG